MADAGQDLSEKVAAAWEKYESTVRCGGTPEERRFAFARVLEADQRLRVFDQAQRSKEQRARATRAQSGA